MGVFHLLLLAHLHGLKCSKKETIVIPRVKRNAIKRKEYLKYHFNSDKNFFTKSFSSPLEKLIWNKEEALSSLKYNLTSGISFFGFLSLRLFFVFPPPLDPSIF